MSDLLPCPFCGAPAKMDRVDDDIDDSNYGAGFVQCSKCFASSALRFPYGDNIDRQLLEAWNRRYTRAPEWVKCSERPPRLGQLVDLFSNGVVQNNTFTYSIAETFDGYAWRTDADESSEYPVKPEDQWRERPLPPPPEDTP